ncbi:MAG: hypothetical protein JXL20_01295 [Deltaproteobacteria bacterium]|nr:hypothetical protein [Deltaproteobacteria bacterium]
MNNRFRTSYRYAGILIVLGLFLFSACSTMPVKESAGSAAQISVTGTGLPKADMLITGSGFKPGETIELELNINGLPMLIGEQANKPVVASDKGTLQRKSAYPDKAVLVPGTWDLYANGNKGSKAQCKVPMKLK